MAKVTMIFEDNEAGTVDVEVEYDPEVPDHTMPSELTEAQNLALVTQELLMEYLRQSDDVEVIRDELLQAGKLN